MKTIFKTAVAAAIALAFTVNSLAGDFNFVCDYCVFKSDDGRLFLELYYSFDQTKLTFIRVDNVFEAAGEIDIDLINKTTNDVIIQKRFKVPVTVNDTAGYDKSKNLMGQVNFLLDSGRYVFKIKGSDFNKPQDSSVYNDNLELKRFEESSIVISSIQVASGIQKSTDKNSVFYKNTLEITPNPNRLFGNNLANLYYYFEVYNLKKEYLSEDYFIVSEVTDLNNNVLKSQEKKFQLKGESKVEYGYFDVSNLATNPYNLVIRVVNDKNKPVALNSRRFVIFNSDSSNVNYEKYKDDYMLSEYVNYSDDQLDEEFACTVYTATETENDRYDNIKNLDGKRKFLYEFWKKRDPNPLTLQNEFKIDYFARIKYANTNYKYDFTEGWKTDRGRVYILYGKPDEIDRYPFEADKRAHEIWNYNSLQGGVIFVFVDMSNSGGNYGLVHSTARNELRDDNWEGRLRLK